MADENPTLEPTRDARPTSRFLIDESPLIILPTLATRIGLNRAVVLQQVQYWISNVKVGGKVIDGQKWVSITHDEWIANFPFWSRNTILNTVKGLESDGLLLCGFHSGNSFDRTKFYRIDYDALDKINKAPPKRKTKNKRKDYPNFGEWAKKQRTIVQTLDNLNVQTLENDPSETNNKTTLSPAPSALVESAPQPVPEPQRETAIVALMESIASQPESPAIQDKEPHAEGKEVLPPPPDGFVWIESSVSTLQGTVHLSKRDAKLPHALCKAHLKHIGMTHQDSAPCATCLEIASKPKKEKPTKAAIYSNAELFEAIGAFSFGANDAADLRAVAGRVGKIREALADYVCAKSGGAPDAERIAEVVARVKELPDFYRTECKDCTPPATPDTFMTWYTKMLAKRGGNGNGTGVRYVWRGKEWPVYEGRVHVEIMPNVHRNIPASAAYWQSFLEEMDREEKHNAAVARK